MEKVKVKHLGVEEFKLHHGNVVEVFAPGAARRVPQHIADVLLREQAVERKWKEDGALLSERRIPLFEEVKEKAPKPPTAKNKNSRRVAPVKKAEDVSAEQITGKTTVETNTEEARGNEK